jgi:hypothetical protein
MITLAPRIPPINYSKSQCLGWRIVDNQTIVYGNGISKTISLNHILECPLELFTEFTTILEAKGLLYALIAEGVLSGAEVTAIYTIFPL